MHYQNIFSAEKSLFSYKEKITPGIPSNYQLHFHLIVKTVWFFNAQLWLLVIIWRFGFQNTRVFLLKLVNESKVRYPRQSDTTCWIVTSWEDISVIGRELNHLLKIKEILFIKRDNPSVKYRQILAGAVFILVFICLSRIIFVLTVGLWLLFL